MKGFNFLLSLLLPFSKQKSFLVNHLGLVKDISTMNLNILSYYLNYRSWSVDWQKGDKCVELEENLLKMKYYSCANIIYVDVWSIKRTLKTCSGVRISAHFVVPDVGVVRMAIEIARFLKELMIFLQYSR